MIRTIAIVVSVLFFCLGSYAQNNDSISVKKLPDAEVRAVRWKSLSMTPATQIIKTNQDIQTNVGFDIPQSLQALPSLVYSSDAGNNIGYTNMKIRGSDATRINVSINGVPYNDAESQNTFFVDIADILSSTQDIQVSNGIGSSTNGTGALGASISINTSHISDRAAASLSASVGSYGTLRSTLQCSTGKIKGYKANVRFSSIRSEGYVDRASSRLFSWQINQSLALSPKHELKLLLFGGHEITGQSWNGISLSDFKEDPQRNFIGQREDGSYYPNQVDDYTQNHAQFFLNSYFNAHWSSSFCLYLTTGMGFYEEYKQAQDYQDYGLEYPIISRWPQPDSLITSTSLVRQLWLDNRLLGNNFSISYESQKPQGLASNVLGYGINMYDGQHYGLVIWAREGHVNDDYKWYENEARKMDFNVYNKSFFRLGDKHRLGVDLQYRYINYSIDGFRDNPDIEKQLNYHFFNPKISYRLADIHSFGGGDLEFKAFLGRSSKEPIRGDFENSQTSVRPESVIDLELGTSYSLGAQTITTNLYNMSYTDQLILTGKVNDVGAYIRENVARSVRRGIELSYTGSWGQGWSTMANATFSSNKIQKITVYYDDYDAGSQIAEQYENTDISFSPNRIAYLRLDKAWRLSEKSKMKIGLRAKSVSKQFLDNTQNGERSIPSFTTLDFLSSWEWGQLNRTSLFLQVLNLTNRKYYNNGYTFSYQYGQTFTTENYIYPQAQMNFMLGVKVDLKK